MNMVALKAIAAGQQIFNDFGQLPRSDLLRRYGFITNNYRKWDVVEVGIETITEAANKYNKLTNAVSNLYKDDLPEDMVNPILEANTQVASLRLFGSPNHRLLTVGNVLIIQLT